MTINVWREGAGIVLLYKKFRRPFFFFADLYSTFSVIVPLSSYLILVIRSSAFRETGEPPLAVWIGKCGKLFAWHCKRRNRLIPLCYV